MNYLTEAFKELKLLNEETFSFDKDGALELQKFYDGDNTDDYESIIDPKAEDEEELQDSYEGKVIVACGVCHELQYKDPADIIIDEASEMVNIEESCPVCYSTGGFKVIGEVAPYCAKCEDDEPKQEEPKLEESFEGCYDDATKKLAYKLVSMARKDGKKLSVKDACEALDQSYNADASSLEDFYRQLDLDALTEDVGDDSLGVIYDEVLKLFDELDYDTEHADVKNYASSVAEYIEMSRSYGEEYSVEQWYQDTKMNYPEDLEALPKRAPLTESVENVTVETNTDVIEVLPSEDGKVEVKAEPKGGPAEESEVIVPVSDEVKTEIENNDANFDEDELNLDEINFDEEGFDTLSESYLKKIYSNVDSFKTSKVDKSGKSVMVEGVITFASGKKAKTSFLFEDIQITKKGKVKFLGENLAFSKNKKAFTLVTDKSGLCESLTYSYTAKDAVSNKKVPLYGTVRK